MLSHLFFCFLHSKPLTRIHQRWQKWLNLSFNWILCFMFSDQAFSFWNRLDRIILIVLLSDWESQFGWIPDTFQLFPKLLISLQSNNNSLFIFAPIIELSESSVVLFLQFLCYPLQFQEQFVRSVRCQPLTDLHKYYTKTRRQDSVNCENPHWEKFISEKNSP